MKALALLTCLMLNPVTERKFEYAVSLNGAAAGSAEMTVKTLPDERRQVLLTMDVKVGASSALIRQETIYEKDGSASRKILESSVDKQGRRLVVAEFTATSAKVTTTADGKTTTKDYTVSASAPQSNAATYWFDRTQPKVGERLSAYSFDLNDLEWRLTTTTYSGRESVQVGGKTIQAHKVIISRSGNDVVNYLDDQGFPIVMMQGETMRIERKPAK